MVNKMASNKNRKIRKKYFNISYKDVKKLVGVRYSCLEEIEHKMTVPLSPKYVGSVTIGLKEELTNVLFLFNEDLEGVPLAYNRIKVVNSSIIDDQEFISLDIIVNFVIFKPKMSKIVSGTVTKITDHHFGCVFHNCVNGSVRRPHQSHLTDEQKEFVEKIDVGDEIILKIHKIHSDNDILFVLGDLAQQHYRRMRKSSQCSMNGDGEMDNNNDNNNASESTTEKTTTFTEVKNSISSPKKKLKKRKRKHDNTASGNEEISSTENDVDRSSSKLRDLDDGLSSPVKKKKKKKKNT